MNRTAAAIFLALVCAGCPKRIDFGPEGPLTDPWAVLEGVQRAQAGSQLVSLQGEGRLRVESPQGRGSVSAWVALMRPDRLRLELSDFFNRPLALVATDGERFSLYQVQENTWYQGPATPGNLAQVLPVALPPEELVSLLLGQVPLLPAEQVTLRVDEGQGLYELRLRRGGLTQEVWVHPTHMRVVRSRVEGVYEVEYEDFRGQGALLLPGEVELRAEGQGEVRLRYGEVQLNEALEPSLFQPEVPPGARSVEVEAGGQELPDLPLPPPAEGTSPPPS